MDIDFFPFWPGTSILRWLPREFVLPPFRESFDEGWVRKFALVQRADWVAIAMIKEFLADCIDGLWWTKEF
jgi:hypothetical protein